MEPEMKYAITKLHFRDPPSPESLGEGLVWVNASCVDRAGTWTPSSDLRYVRVGKDLSWAFPRFMAI